RIVLVVGRVPVDVSPGVVRTPRVDPPPVLSRHHLPAAIRDGHGRPHRGCRPRRCRLGGPNQDQQACHGSQELTPGSKNGRRLFISQRSSVFLEGGCVLRPTEVPDLVAADPASLSLFCRPLYRDQRMAGGTGAREKVTSLGSKPVLDAIALG